MIKGIPVAELITRFFGDVSRYPVEADGVNFTQAQIQAVCEHIHRTGDCLWHAQHIVLGGPCHCASCAPPQPPNAKTVYVPARPARKRSARRG